MTEFIIDREITDAGSLSDTDVQDIAHTSCGASRRALIQPPQNTAKHGDSP